MKNISFEAEIPIDKFILPYPSRETIERHKEIRPFFDNIPKNGIGAEIGVLEANNAYFVCKYDKPKFLYLVDEYQKYHDITGDLSIFSQEIWDELYKVAQERMKDFPVKFIRKSSLEAAKDIPDGYLDFCYIDANHEKDKVTEDIHAWYPKVKKGGVFGGHDIIEIEVKSAVMEWLRGLENNPDFNYGFNDWWVMK